MSASTLPSLPSDAVGSLYVGDLMADVNETLLFEIFNAVGPVASVKVCRDMKTKKSLGYAYVNFHNMKDAERAIDCMNFTSIKGQTCRIMWVNRDNAVRDKGVGNIVVKNLDETIDNKMLFDTFSMFGSILSCKIGFNRETGDHLGYAFVHYAEQAAADKAIEQINDMVLAGRKVIVEKFQSKEQREEQQQNEYTNIYVKNIPSELNVEQIFDILKKYGQVESRLIPEGKDDAKNCGFCYCNYRTHEEAKAAVAGLNEVKGEDGKLIEASRCLSKAELKRQSRQNKIRMTSTNLYVKNLPSYMDDDGLKELFSKFGNISSAKVMIDKHGLSKQFGFVNFEREDEASLSMAEMNGKDLNGLKLYVGLAQTKNERKSILSKKFAKTAPAVAPTPAFGFVPPSPHMMRPPFGNHFPGMGFGGPGIPRAPMMSMHAPPRHMGMDPMMHMHAPPRGGMMPQPRPASFRAIPSNGRKSLLESLAGKSPEQQKQIIGEKLYNSIQKVEPKKAGKITGMLLEMETTELLILVESEAELIKKVNEALIVLRQHSI